MDNWNYHDKKMKELKQLYLKTSKQTQNTLQEIIDTFKFDFDTLYNVADTKTKKRVNTYIEEWKDKGLLTGYFGTLAKSIYGRTRVKNSEIEDNEGAGVNIGTDESDFQTGVKEGAIYAEINLEKMYEFRSKCTNLKDVKDSYEVIKK